jgi:hypothetical protein
MAIGIFAALQLALMITWMMTSLPALQGPASTAASLSFVSSLVLLGVSYLEHTKSLRPSALINSYLFFTVLFDLAIVRTLWLAFPSNAIRELFTTSFAIKAVILVLEAKEKRDYVPTDNNMGPEETSGLYSQSFVWWLNSMIKQGYRHILKPTDLYPVDQSMSSERLNAQFWIEWNRGEPRDLRHAPMLTRSSCSLWQGQFATNRLQTAQMAFLRFPCSASRIIRVYVLPTTACRTAVAVPPESR